MASTNPSAPITAGELESALKLARTLTRADMSVLLMHDERAGTVVPAAGQGISPAQLAQVGAHRAGADPFGIALVERHPVVVREAWRREAKLGRLAKALGFRSIEIIPLVGIDGRVIGEIAMMFRRSRGASRRERRMIARCVQLVVAAAEHAHRARLAERERDRAEEAGRARVQFLGRMSHELRTPLQSILGYLDLLLMGNGQPPSPEQARMLTRIQHSTEILRHVIEDLITYSRIEAGGVSYEIAPVRAEDMLGVASQVVEPLAAARGVAIQAMPCDGIYVAADGAKLKQILINLTANAVKFAQSRIELTCRPDLPGTTAVFAVSDDGPGIPSDKMETIFEPYVQLKSPLLDRFGGTGLGLAISRDFARGMCGELSASARTGGGSVFSLRLPRLRPDGGPIALGPVRAA